MQNLNKNPRSAAVWNILGSGLNAAATMILTVAASRIGGIDAGGVMGLAFGICFIFFSLACFEIRPYQSTDLEEKYSFPAYLGNRLATSLAAWVICGGYVLIRGDAAEKGTVVFLVCTFKILEAVSDVFQGDFQQKGRLEYAGMSLFWKNAAGIALFIGLYAGTGNLPLAAAGMPAASLGGILLFDRRKAAGMKEDLRPGFRRADMAGLFRECWPLAVSSFLTMYVMNAGRIQVDRICPELEGCWTALFMPASFANLFGLFAFRPMLTTLRAGWNEGRIRDFLKTCGKLSAAILAAGAGVAAAGALIGIPALEWLYRTDLTGRKGVLILILAGGSFNALSVFLWYLVIVVRRQKTVALADTVVFLFSLAAVPPMIRAGELRGAALSYLISTLLRAALLAAAVFREVRRAEADGRKPEGPGA